jgi:hypothetical protein
VKISSNQQKKLFPKKKKSGRDKEKLPEKMLTGTAIFSVFLH